MESKRSLFFVSTSSCCWLRRRGRYRSIGGSRHRCAGGGVCTGARAQVSLCVEREREEQAKKERVRERHTTFSIAIQSRLRKPTFVGECGEFEAWRAILSRWKLVQRRAIYIWHYYYIGTTTTTEFPVHFVHPLYSIFNVKQPCSETEMK